MRLKNKVYSQEEISARVKELGKQISNDYDGKPIVCVCVLSGAVMFFTDLVKELADKRVIFDFIKLSSYQDSTSCGRVMLVHDCKQDLSGKHVLIIEDIVDSGCTVQFLRAHFALKNALDVKIATLLDKPMGRKVDGFGKFVGLSKSGGAENSGYLGAYNSADCLGAENDVNADYTAFTLKNDKFIVGYGLDYNQEFRNLSSIYELEL